MLRPRIIPCLLVRKRGLVKTVQFRADKYVGDPINAVRIFNEKEADELMILDIDATANGREPDVQTIRLSEPDAAVLRGGSAPAALTIVGVGVEKVARLRGVHDPDLVTESQKPSAARACRGPDVRKTGDTYQV